MRKFSLLSVVLLILSTLFVVNAYAKGNVKTSSIIKYEKDGRVSGVKNAQKLSDQDLSNVMSAIGFKKEITKSLSRSEKINIVKKGGKTVDLKIKSVKKVYVSLEGKQIEYNEMNKQLIKEQKLKDVKRYNELTGENKSVLELPGEEPLKINGEIENSSAFMDAYGVPSATTATGVLPNYGIADVTNGDLYLSQQVNYLGTDSAGNLDYKLISVANWMGHPASTKTDGFATVFDQKATPKANTFDSRWSQDKEIADGMGGTTWIQENKILQADPDAFSVYGHGVKVPLGEGDYQMANMSREVLVNTAYLGHPAYVLTKYHHTYGTITGLGINIGPVSISFSGTWGDDTMVEYGYVYGDVNMWDVY
ncbi:MAG: hypothetical protein K0Q49_2580 [Haloplasmataceae bacterium]|jgi:hypothetical protein|nr:hypothetical protein [Haloplasmataceae bacterium]